MKDTCTSNLTTAFENNGSEKRKLYKPRSPVWCLSPVADHLN